MSHYWRRDEVDRAQALHEAEERFAGLSDLMAPWAVRVAATLGVADVIAEGATTATEVAKQCGADITAMRTLLTYLATKQVFRLDGDQVGLTGVSELLLDGDEHGWRELPAS